MTLPNGSISGRPTSALAAFDHLVQDALKQLRPIFPGVRFGWDQCEDGERYGCFYTVRGRPIGFTINDGPHGLIVRDCEDNDAEVGTSASIEGAVAVVLDVALGGITRGTVH